jgi:hypothetical protein
MKNNLCRDSKSFAGETPTLDGSNLSFSWDGLVTIVDLSYIEIYPVRSLRLLGGTSMLDAENESRSRD